MNFDPRKATSHDDPFPLYAELLEHHPIHRAESGDLWVVSRYDDVRSTILDDGLFSSASGIVPSGFLALKPMIITTDPPLHTHLRKAVQHTFTPRRIQAMERRIREITVELLDAVVPGQEVDLVAALTDPLPVAVISELLGVNLDDQATFKGYADTIIHGAGANPDATLEAQHWIYAYIEHLLRERKNERTDDLLGLLVNPPEGGEVLTHDEILGFCMILLLAGTETTTNAMSNSFVLLERHPELREKLAADPSGLPGAIEECLRLESPVQGLARRVMRDVEIHGQRIREGERVHMLFAAANRDARMFPNPDVVDPSRDPNPHMAFGFGIHFCMGASLARMELRVGIGEFLARFPEYRVQHERSQRQESDTNRGFSSLSVVCDAG